MQLIRYWRKKQLRKSQSPPRLKGCNKCWGNIKLLNKKILSTLAYHSIFDYPLTIEEIHRFLISDHQIAQKDVREAITELMRFKQIMKSGSWYSIPSAFSHQPFAFTTLRRSRQKISQKKRTIACRASCVIGKLPWIKLVAVTGALAMDNADERDDIDLMIVTEKNRLWIARPLVILLISLFFKCRKSNLSNMSNSLNLANALCLNLWLDELALVIPASQRNVYAAHELAQMKPIVNRNGTYERMMVLNMWGKKYLANTWERINQPINQYTNKPINQWNPFNILNKITFGMQFQYMKSKMTTERVSLHSAFFHPGDRAQAVLRLYKKILDKHKIDI